MVLTEEDVQKLVGDSTPESRIEITNKLTFTYSNTRMSPTETVVAEQIFRLLMRDLEVRVRATLANNIKENANMPRDIVLTLARDVEEVSLPMLQYSEVLDDNDLVEIIQSTKELSRHLAVSRRRQVSGKVSDTLLETGSEEVTKSLLGNLGAYLSEKSLEKIIETFGDDEAMMGAVSRRPQLPLGAVEKLINVVSSSLADELKKKYRDAPKVAAAPVDLPKQNVEIQKEVEKVKESETLNMLGSSWAQEDIDKLITQLIAYDRLTPSLIMRALCQGNFNFFETSLARLSNIALANARTLITDKGDLGFRAIYNKSGLPDAMFPAVKLLNRVVRELHEEGEDPASAQFANRIVERILHYAEEDPVENLAYIIALIRRVSQ